MDKQAHMQLVTNQIDQAIDALVPNGAGPVTDRRLRDQMEKVAAVAFREGQHYVLTSLLTVEDVAEKFNVTPRRVRAIAQNRHERFGIGWQVPGTNQWLFRPEELEHLAPDVTRRRK